MITYLIHKGDLKTNYPDLLRKIRWSGTYLMFNQEVIFFKSKFEKDTYAFHFRTEQFHDRMVKISKVSKSLNEKNELIKFILEKNYEMFNSNK